MVVVHTNKSLSRFESTSLAKLSSFGSELPRVRNTLWSSPLFLTTRKVQAIKTAHICANVVCNL